MLRNVSTAITVLSRNHSSNRNTDNRGKEGNNGISMVTLLTELAICVRRSSFITCYFCSILTETGT